MIGQTTRSDSADEVVVEIVGELDLDVAPRVRAELNEAADELGERELIVDLRALDFADSTALSLLLDTHEQLKGRGGRMRILVIRGPVQRLFELSGVDEALAVEIVDA